MLYTFSADICFLTEADGAEAGASPLDLSSSEVSVFFSTPVVFSFFYLSPFAAFLLGVFFGELNTFSE